MYRVIAIGLIAGCSYLQIDRPPRAVRRGDTLPACTTDTTWPLADVVIAGIATVSGIAITAGLVHPTKMNGDGTMTELSSSERYAAGAGGIVEGLLFAWSGVYGFRTVAACRDLHARLGATP